MFLFFFFGLEMLLTFLFPFSFFISLSYHSLRSLLFFIIPLLFHHLIISSSLPFRSSLWHIMAFRSSSWHFILHHGISFFIMSFHSSSCYFILHHPLYPLLTF